MMLSGAVCHVVVMCGETRYNTYTRYTAADGWPAGPARLVRPGHPAAADYFVYILCGLS